MNDEARKSGRRSFFVDYLVPIIVTIGVAIVLFGDVVLISDKEPDTFRTFYSLSSGMDEYYEFKTAWKPRLFSNALALMTTKAGSWILARTDVPMVREPLDLVVGLWSSGWYVLACILFILFFKRRALFYVFGLYAGISFGYLSGLREAPQVYPWDLPALFFYALFVLLFIKGKYWWILVLIPISVGFKETGIILCLAFLFVDTPLKQRLMMFSGAAALSLGVKVFIDWYTHAPLFFTMETRLEEGYEYYFINNLSAFNAIIPYFINAGTLVALFLLPNLNRNILVLKLISIPFILGIFLFGIADEYRIWFEMIPFSLYALDVAMYGDPVNDQVHKPLIKTLG